MAQVRQAKEGAGRSESDGSPRQHDKLVIDRSTEQLEKLAGTTAAPPSSCASSTVPYVTVQGQSQKST